MLKLIKSMLKLFTMKTTLLADKLLVNMNNFLAHNFVRACFIHMIDLWGPCNVNKFKPIS